MSDVKDFVLSVLKEEYKKMGCDFDFKILQRFYEIEAANIFEDDRKQVLDQLKFLITHYIENQSNTNHRS